MWKHTVWKSPTNATCVIMHPLGQTVWGNIWIHTVEKSQTNVTCVTSHALTRVLSQTLTSELEGCSNFHSLASSQFVQKSGWKMWAAVVFSRCSTPIVESSSFSLTLFVEYGVLVVRQHWPQPHKEESWRPIWRSRWAHHPLPDLVLLQLHNAILVLSLSIGVDAVLATEDQQQRLDPEQGQLLTRLPWQLQLLPLLQWAVHLKL